MLIGEAYWGRGWRAWTLALEFLEAAANAFCSRPFDVCGVLREWLWSEGGLVFLGCAVGDFVCARPTAGSTSRVGESRVMGSWRLEGRRFLSRSVGWQAGTLVEGAVCGDYSHPSLYVLLIVYLLAGGLCGRAVCIYGNVAKLD